MKHTTWMIVGAVALVAGFTGGFIYDTVVSDEAPVVFETMSDGKKECGRKCSKKFQSCKKTAYDAAALSACVTEFESCKSACSEGSSAAALAPSNIKPITK
jgi:hypothetical protein